MFTDDCRRHGMGSIASPQFARLPSLAHRGLLSQAAQDVGFARPRPHVAGQLRLVGSGLHLQRTRFRRRARAHSPAPPRFAGLVDSRWGCLRSPASRRSRRRRSPHDPRRADPTQVSEEAFAKARRVMPSGFWVALLHLLTDRLPSNPRPRCAGNSIASWPSMAPYRVAPLASVAAGFGVATIGKAVGSANPPRALAASVDPYAVSLRMVRKPRRENDRAGRCCSASRPTTWC